MTNKMVYAHDDELQAKIVSGVNHLADYVASTLGPRGRNVIIHRDGKDPIITKVPKTTKPYTKVLAFILNTARSLKIIHFIFAKSLILAV